ncbi:MAG: thiamine-phosphate synthase family protein [Halobacteriaceae archaeon]
MRFIEELVVEEFLPTYRSMLATALRDRGLTQREVADALGVSQSAVSKYAHGDVTQSPRIRADDRVQDLVDRTAEGLASEELTPVGALVEAEVLIRELESQGDVLATLHAEAMPGLADKEVGLGIHDPEGEVRSRERTLADVRRGLRGIEATGGFAALLPAVGSNLVACLPDAATLGDVAGVPGRLFDVKGRVEVPADPEFGVSGHVARVLLAARDAGSDARAALNIRYDETIVADLEAAGLESVAFDPEVDLDTAVTSAVSATPSAAVLYQTGAFGIEPVTYVLGPDAQTVVEQVRTLV